MACDLHVHQDDGDLDGRDAAIWLVGELEKHASANLPIHPLLDDFAVLLVLFSLVSSDQVIPIFFTLCTHAGQLCAAEVMRAAREDAEAPLSWFHEDGNHVIKSVQEQACAIEQAAELVRRSMIVIRLAEMSSAEVSEAGAGGVS